MGAISDETATEPHQPPPQPLLFRSAWLKWARAMEHKNTLGRSVLDYRDRKPYEYQCTDNSKAAEDPLIRVHWRYKVLEAHPERWSILIGDFLANLRDALDHAVWDAAMHHSGPPAKPTQIFFPTCTTLEAFAKPSRIIQPLVAPELWDVIDGHQPFHVGDNADRHPLAALHWLSIRDKHRATHVVSRLHVAMADPLVRSNPPLELVERWVHEGPIEDGTVLARLKFRRPAHIDYVEFQPLFAHGEAVQVSDHQDGETPTLVDTLDSLGEAVLAVLFMMDRAAGQQTVVEDLDFGEVPAPANTEAGQ